MTQRWRKKLGDLDKTGPDDDVFERAKEGPSLTDEPEPGPKTSTRIITAVAAFAVFALAISVFAIPALRMQGTGAGAASGLFPLWPSQTSDQLRQLQADADAGQAPWALDPQLVAQRFAQQVMGWENAVASRSVGSRCSWLDGPIASPLSPAPSYACNVASWPPSTLAVPSGDASVGYLEPSRTGCAAAAQQSYPGRSESAEVICGRAGAAGPGGGRAFVFYDVVACHGGTADPGCGLAGPVETLTLYQPLEQGDGKVWAVLSANSKLAHVSVVAGQSVRSGANVGGTFNDANPALGYRSCGTSDASSSYEQMIPGDHISLDVRLPASAACEGAQPGYVWGAVGDPTLIDTSNDGVTRDPIADGSSCGADACLEGITAVPVVMTFPDVNVQQTDAAQPSVVGATQSPVADRWVPFTDDRVGWTMYVPSTWTSKAIANTPVTGLSGTGQEFAGDGLTVDVFQGEALVIPRDDPSYPLDYDRLLTQLNDGALVGDLQGNGEPVSIRVTPEGGHVTPEQEAVLRRMVASIAFPHLQPGDRQGMVVAVEDPHQQDQWMQVANEWLILKQTSGGYVALAPVTCADGGLLTHWDPSTTCPDSTQLAQWDAAGSPLPGNATGFQHPIDVHPVVRAWDGTLLAVVGITDPGASTDGSPSVSPPS